MEPSDSALLEKVKRKIAAEANLVEMRKWSQKDFEFLSFFIEEKTGCRLSVSTLKRIWSNDYRRLPHISTLNALSTAAFDKNWQNLKSASITNRNAKKVRSFKVRSVGQKKSYRKIAIGLLLVIPIVLILIGAATVIQKGQPKRTEVTEVSFGHTKTLENQLPNTVVFQYDIEAIDADRFFLQQSWDRSRRVEIFKGNREQTDIYYIPGYFTAKLIADEEVIKEMPVHVTYENWFIAARQPMSNIVTFDKYLWLRKNYLGIDTETLGSKGIDVNRDFQLAYYHVKDFDVDGDNLTYKASFKMDPLENVDCPIINIHLQGAYGYYWIMIGNKGCGSELSQRVGDKSYDGRTQDLTKLTTNIYQWNEFEIRTTNKNVHILLNGSEVFSTSYKTSIDGIMEISYFFNGMGLIDNVELRDGQGEIKFSDEFQIYHEHVP
ncbi:hypothetical protein HME9304_01386 [Flagellimonas maritima]|uniref:Uncharacterized protein n=1 Tax=Flagellimonas maritima TaxID=1383885 RepID=A0A2Z4LRC4_9FLAO|nr:hypothetical protein [Allomuricauda aurantiaca]AWX44386.1 hypothetical protein HME9304_01386 [Allomuricauda aurantiaca]